MSFLQEGSRLSRHDLSCLRQEGRKWLRSCHRYFLSSWLHHFKDDRYRCFSQISVVGGHSGVIISHRSFVCILWLPKHHLEVYFRVPSVASSTLDMSSGFLETNSQRALDLLSRIWKKSASKSLHATLHQEDYSHFLTKKTCLKIYSGNFYVLVECCLIKVEALSRPIRAWRNSLVLQIPQPGQAATYQRSPGVPETCFWLCKTWIFWVHHTRTLKKLCTCSVTNSETLRSLVWDWETASPDVYWSELVESLPIFGVSWIRKRESSFQSGSRPWTRLYWS